MALIALLTPTAFSAYEPLPPARDYLEPLTGQVWRYDGGLTVAAPTGETASYVGYVDVKIYDREAQEARHDGTSVMHLCNTGTPVLDFCIEGDAYLVGQHVVTLGVYWDGILASEQSFFSNSAGLATWYFTSGKQNCIGFSTLRVEARVNGYLADWDEDTC